MIECEKENNYAFKTGCCVADAFSLIGILSMGFDSSIWLKEIINRKWDKRKK